MILPIVLVFLFWYGGSDSALRPLVISRKLHDTTLATNRVFLRPFSPFCKYFHFIELNWHEMRSSTHSFSHFLIYPFIHYPVIYSHHKSNQVAVVLPLSTAEEFFFLIVQMLKKDLIRWEEQKGKNKKPAKNVFPVKVAGTCYFLAYPPIYKKLSAFQPKHWALPTYLFSNNWT